MDERNDCTDEPTLCLDGFGRLVLQRPGADPVAGIVPVRCFPFTAPNERISLCDEQGREVHCIPDLAKTGDQTRELIQCELARREFVPCILKINGITPDSEPTSWDVETDRGHTRFLLTSEDHVRRIQDRGVLITASDGVRFLVADRHQLDGQSRKLLRRYL